MTVPEERDGVPEAEPESSLGRAAGRGLAPVAETMFGALADRMAVASAVPGPRPETSPCRPA